MAAQPTKLRQQGTRVLRGVSALLLLPVQASCLDMLVLPILALVLHQHRTRKSSKWNTSASCFCEGAGQLAGTIPTSIPTTVIRVSSPYPFSYSEEKVET